ncbi:MAG: radical SAM protein [Herpetosiphonaceae bacterium]|nr:radical SAM protein [Herpetosiphonaceae bacterium]
MQCVLISTYDGGHQPFGLASPAAWLQAAGADVACVDLAVEALPHATLAGADLVAFYLPMHTATRIASSIIPQVRQLNPHAHLCCYGLYAPMNEAFLRSLGVATILGGEFEQGLLDLVAELGTLRQPIEPWAQRQPLVSLDRQTFLVPDRSTLPPLARYAWLQTGANTKRTVGYTEASRGCKHLCRHCPVVPVYQGRFRIVQPEVVLADIQRQVAAGAQHITFGDPDFLNGPRHALAIITALHEQFPDLTYDATIKIEHLLKHRAYLPLLRNTGCLFVTTAVEALDDTILAIFDKRHTAAEFKAVVALFRQVGLALNPTFVSFTPWTSRQGYLAFLAAIQELELIENVAPIQYAIRLLIPAGSKLLELSQVQQLVGMFDETALSYPWVHADPEMDRLYTDVRQAVQAAQAQHAPRQAIWERVWSLAKAGQAPARDERHTYAGTTAGVRRGPIPYLSEPWYC